MAGVVGNLILLIGFYEVSHDIAMTLLDDTALQRYVSINKKILFNY